MPPATTTRPTAIIHGYPVGPAGYRPLTGLAAWWNRPATVLIVVLVILALVVATLALAVFALTSESRIPTAEAVPATAGPTPTLLPVLPPQTTPEAAQVTNQPESSPVPVDTEPAHPGLPAFGESDVDALSSGTARLELDSYGVIIDRYGWRTARGYGGRDDGTGSDIAFTASGMAARGANQLALLDDSVPKSFPTCEAQRTWLPALTWSQLIEGSFVCVKTGDGRRGLLRIDDMPDLDASRPVVQITGVTWLPVVNG